MSGKDAFRHGTKVKSITSDALKKAYEEDPSVLVKVPHLVPKYQWDYDSRNVLDWEAFKPVLENDLKGELSDDSPNGMFYYDEVIFLTHKVENCGFHHSWQSHQKSWKGKKRIHC